MGQGRKKFRKEDWITLGLTFALGLLFALLSSKIPHRALILTELLLLLAAIVYRIILRYLHLEVGSRFFILSNIISISVLVTMLLILMWETRYYFYDDKGAFPFGWIALAVTVILLIVGACLLYKKRSYVSPILCVVILLVVGALLFLVTHPILEHLNCLLDPTPPIEYTATVERKEHHHNTKLPDSFEFQISANGQILDLEVQENIYNRYEVGDTYRFYKYYGAFGKSFYLSDPSFEE